MNESPASRAWRRLYRSRSAWIGGVIVIAMAVLAVAADVIAPYDPQAIVGVDANRAQSADQAAYQPPSMKHWLGTDGVGRDILSRVIYGARMSLAAGLVSVTLAVVIGATAGAAAGYLGGWCDLIVSRTVDMLLSVPSILLALVVYLALSAGWPAVMIAVGLMNVPTFCRQIRAQTLVVARSDYVTATVALGASPLYVLWHVILPAITTPIIVLASLTVGTAILEVAGLSFLGISGEIDVPEWGNMLSEAKSSLRSSIWPALAPGVAISLCVIGCNLLGDGVRDAIDPQRAGRGE